MLSETSILYLICYASFILIVMYVNKHTLREKN